MSRVWSEELQILTFRRGSYCNSQARPPQQSAGARHLERDLTPHLCCLLIVSRWKSSGSHCLANLRPDCGSIKEKFSCNEVRHERALLMWRGTMVKSEKSKVWWKLQSSAWERGKRYDECCVWSSTLAIYMLTHFKHSLEGKPKPSHYNWDNWVFIVFLHMYKIKVRFMKSDGSSWWISQRLAVSVVGQRRDDSVAKLF